VTSTSAEEQRLRDLALDDYHLFHAVRADLLERVGRTDEALTAYDDALARVANGAERDLLARRRAELATA